VPRQWAWPGNSGESSAHIESVNNVRSAFIPQVTQSIENTP
jgi:hypothetical protein